MKKIYVAPDVECVNLEMESLIAISEIKIHGNSEGDGGYADGDFEELGNQKEYDEDSYWE